MSTTQKLGAGIAIAVIAFVFAPQAWAANAGSASSAAAATSAKAAVSTSSSAIPEALQKALAQPEGKDQVKAVQDAAVEWQKSDPAAALAWVVAQPPSPLIRSTVIAVSQAWAKRDAPAAVPCAWGMVKKKGKCDGYEKDALHLTLKQWARSDPKAAASWTDATVPADSSKDVMRWVYGSVTGGWAEVDPVACAAWAEKLKSDEGRQWGIQALAVTWCFHYKPEDAAAWAKRLPPGDLKSVAGYMAVGCIFNYLNKRDAAKATAWLDSLTLPDEMKAELKKKAEPMKPKK